MAAIYITLDEAKAHLRVNFDEDDTYIGSLCELVEEIVLNEIQGSMPGKGTVTTNGTTSLVGTMSNFLDYSVGDTITVYGETVRSIATITDDEHLTVDVAFSTTDSSLPYTMHTGMPLVGGEIPLRLKQAMLMLLGYFYAVREPVVLGINATELPFGFKYLVSYWKNWTIS